MNHSKEAVRFNRRWLCFSERVARAMYLPDVLKWLSDVLRRRDIPEDVVMAKPGQHWCGDCADTVCANVGKNKVVYCGAYPQQKQEEAR